MDRARGRVEAQGRGCARAHRRPPRALGAALAIAAVLASPMSALPAHAARCALDPSAFPDLSPEVTSYLFVTCAAEVTVPEAGRLPVTGSDAGQLAGLAGVLIALGGAATVASRRGRTHGAGDDATRP